MLHIDPGATLDSWRAAARRLLQHRVPPEAVFWDEAESPLLSWQDESPASSPPAAPARVPAAFLDLAGRVICHADAGRWALLYRLLWRLTCGGERRLLGIPSDPDVIAALRMEKSIRREIHKMHAFVRFRKAPGTDDQQEYFVAWFEPEHSIVELASPFFRDRFTNMDWSIFTPRGCVHWIGKSLRFTEPLASDPTTRDEGETLWKTYYASIFNPARLKLRAMQSEMPKKFWKNLPETELIPRLIRQSDPRVRSMLTAPTRPALPIASQPYLESLKKF